MQDRFETFTVLIAKISRNIRKIKNQEMAEYNLRSAHISCLYYLYLSDGLTSTELCEKCEEDKATISRSVDYLEKNGFLTYGNKTTKRYRSPIFLTEKGKEAGGKIALKISNVFNEISSELSEHERDLLYKSLSIISDGLGAITSRLTEKKSLEDNHD